MDEKTVIVECTPTASVDENTVTMDENTGSMDETTTALQRLKGIKKVPIIDRYSII